MKEWREIDGFPNYMVSNTGKEKVLIPHKLSNGYLGINLYDNDKKSCYLLLKHSCLILMDVGLLIIRMKIEAITL